MDRLEPGQPQPPPFSPDMVELSGHTDDQAIESTWDFERP